MPEIQSVPAARENPVSPVLGLISLVLSPLKLFFGGIIGGIAMLFQHDN